jgi:hypothetical protein
MNDSEMMINRLAQGLVPTDQGILWFSALPLDERLKALTAVRLCCDQSLPQSSDIDAAIALAGLRPTFTPCVMLKKATEPRSALWPITRLPEDEHLKVFKLLLALFTIADKRRRETWCKDGCQHEWHHLYQVHRKEDMIQNIKT